MFLAESVGKSPWKEASAAGSLRRSLNCFRPRYSATSWKSTLMKMRDDEVVSASVMTMYLRGGPEARRLMEGRRMRGGAGS